MRERKKNGLYAVSGGSGDFERKLRAHRLRVARLIFLIILVAILLVLGVYFFLRFKEYDEYKIIRSTEINAFNDAEYIPFSGGVIKVSRDGAIFFDKDGGQIWNQTYEMNRPDTDVCGAYVVIGNLKGHEIYVLNRTKFQGKIETEHPIRGVEVSEKGTVAVLTEGESSYNIVLYDKKGTLLAQGEFHLENSGYPVAIALSSDGLKLGVSFVNIEQGRCNTNVHFYNFGSVGQNEIDNLVGKYSYENTVLPRIEYLDKDVMVAYGMSEVLLFSGDEKPKEMMRIPVDAEIKTIFYTSEYVGLTYDVTVSGEQGNETRHEVSVYDLSGKEMLKQQFTMKYENVRILNGKEIIITRDGYCAIYTFDGVKKFEGEMRGNILFAFKGAGMWDYTFWLQGELVHLRLN